MPSRLCSRSGYAPLRLHIGRALLNGSIRLAESAASGCVFASDHGTFDSTGVSRRRDARASRTGIGNFDLLPHWRSIPQYSRFPQFPIKRSIRASFARTHLYLRIPLHGRRAPVRTDLAADPVIQFAVGRQNNVVLDLIRVARQQPSRRCLRSNSKSATVSAELALLDGYNATLRHFVQCRHPLPI